jgi:hypothetical protein
LQVLISSRNLEPVRPFFEGFEVTIATYPTAVVVFHSHPTQVIDLNLQPTEFAGECRNVLGHDRLLDRFG